VEIFDVLFRGASPWRREKEGSETQYPLGWLKKKSVGSSKLLTVAHEELWPGFSAIVILKPSDDSISLLKNRLRAPGRRTKSWKRSFRFTDLSIVAKPRFCHYALKKSRTDFFNTLL
jgi:hypothetical protein